MLEQAAAGRGLFTIRPERDGIVRRVPMIMVAQGITMPSLTFEMLRVASGSGTILIKADKAGIQSVGVKGFPIPTDANGQLWVHYARRDPSIYVSAVDVLDNRVPPDKIDGKLVLIGTSSTGLNDIKTTPVSPAMPGVEIHAQVLESALTRAVVAQPNYGIALEFFERAPVRAAGDRVRAEFRPGHAGDGRRAVCHRARRHVLVTSTPSTGCCSISPIP